MKVYEFLYNSDCHESGPSTISIHTTRKDAEMAMSFHQNEVKTVWEKENLTDAERLTYPFDYDQFWGVIKTELIGTFVIPRISHFTDENGNDVDINAMGVNIRLLRDGTIEHWLNKGYMESSEILTPIYLDN